MGLINLKEIKPHLVSRDLSGYIIYLYGPGGAGKTTFGSQTEQPLLLAFERGYNAIGGVMVQDIRTWSDMKQVMRQLKDPEVKDLYKTIVVDTVDKASAACEKYICNQLGIENIGDGGWSTNGWSKVKKEWETTFNELTMEGYAVVFISHSKDKTFKRKDGTEYNQIVPSCPNTYNEIIRNMSDIEGYIEVKDGKRMFVLRSANDSVECKSRFANIEPEIEFSYDSLVDALHTAIEKDGEKTNKSFITDAPAEIVKPQAYDFVALKTEFNELVQKLMVDNQSNATKITAIVDKYIGKGKKVSEANPEQADLIYLIVEDIKSDLMK